MKVERLIYIGIGGTGARCLEAVLHLCAAGAPGMPQRLVPLLVEPDSSNGNLTRTQSLLTWYRQVRFPDIKEGFFATRLESIATNDVWDPRGTHATLREFTNWPFRRAKERYLIEALIKALE